MRKPVGYFVAKGGGNEIGRSMYVLIFPESKTVLIIDCGIKFRSQSKGKDNILLPKLEGLDSNWKIFVFFSHGHLDHIGAAAKLKKLYPQAIFFATEPTVGLIEVMGRNSIGIRENNELPLHYNQLELNQLLDAITIVQSSDWIDLENSYQVRFEPAGHIRGAASIFIKTPYGIFLVSGDLGFYDTATVRGASPKFPDKVKWLAIESTNGNSVLPDPKDEFQRLEDFIEKIAKNHGHVLAPLYAVGRGQDIGIHLGRKFGKKMNVLMGGLMCPVAEAYCQNHWESDIPFAGEDEGPDFHLEKEGIQWVTGSHYDLNCVLGRRQPPAIFAVTNGMLQGGISLKVLERIAADPKNAIIVLGYQAEESNGRRLLNLKTGEEFAWTSPRGEKKIIRVLAQIKRFYFSGHADKLQLAKWVENMSPHDKQSLDLAILVHGNQQGQLGLSQKLSTLPNRPKKVLVGVNNKPIPLYI